MSASSKPDVAPAVAHVSVGPLRAEYAVGRSNATGDWVAIGTVHSLMSHAAPPAWILVGIGQTELDAVDDLRHQLAAHRWLAGTRPS